MEKNYSAIIYLPGGEVFTNIISPADERPYKYYRYLAKADAIRFKAKAENWRLQNLKHELNIASGTMPNKPSPYKTTVFHATDDEMTYIADREIRNYFSNDENINRLCRFTSCLCDRAKYESFEITVPIEEDVGKSYTIIGEQITGEPEQIKEITIYIGVEWIDDKNYSLYLEWLN